MRGIKNTRWFTLLAGLVVIGLVGSAGIAGGIFTDQEQSTDSALTISTNYWLSGWCYRIKITIDHNDFDQDVTHFPVLIHLSSACGKGGAYDLTPVFDEVGANSKKIAVTKVDGENQLYVEIEKWDAGAEEAWLWVSKSDWTISSTSDTDIFLYYCNSQPDNTTYVGDPNSTPAENVWDSNFRLVTHLQDDPDTSSIRDSTANNNDGTKAAAGQPAVTTNGQIDDAQDFDGSIDYIRRSSTSSLNLPTAFTISTWLYFEGSPAYEYVIVRNTSTTANAQYGAYIRSPQTGGNWGVIMNGSITDIVNRTWAMNTWTHVVWTWDGSDIRGYFNGGLDGTPVAYSGTLTDQGNWFNIGRRSASVDGNSSSGLFDGRIDEVRVSNIYRGAAWIKASYESERDDLLDFGSEESGTPPTPEPPVITNSTGASNITDNSARLNGELTAGVPDPTVHIYWGDNDGGTTPASWDNDENLGTKPIGAFYKDISGLTASTTYYYRCYATNSEGSDWADTTAQFVTSSALGYYDVISALSPDYWWKLDGDETDSADAANSDGGTDPSWVSSIIPSISGTNQCGNYNGSSSETLIPNQSDINTSTTYQKSISVWIEADTIDTSGNGRAIWAEGYTTNNLVLYTYEDGGVKKIFFKVMESSGTYVDYISYGPISEDTVYHIGATLDCNVEEMHLYVDGSLVASKTGGLNIGNSFSAHQAGCGIGLDYDVTNHNEDSLTGLHDGRIADVVYWAEQAVLSESDFASIHTAGQ